MKRERYIGLNSEEIKKFFASRGFLLFNVLICTIFAWTKEYVGGTVFLVLEISLILILSDDLVSAVAPFLMVTILVAPCYDSFDTFIKFIYLAPIPVFAIIYHFARFRHPVKLGHTFYGLVAVSIALVMGGAGVISDKEYTSMSSLFYMISLGVGMTVGYVIIKQQIDHAKDDVGDRLVESMVYAAIFAAIQVFLLTYFSCVRAGDGFAEFFKKTFSLNQGYYFQASNNLATHLMIYMPFLFYRVKQKKHIYIPWLVVILVALFMTKSRGGLVMGAAEVAVCVVVYSLYIKNKTLKKIILIAACVAVVAGIAAVIYMAVSGELFSKGEARYRLIIRSIEDFFGNPVFGQGIGSTKNNDIYNGKPGTMCWYHMWIPQVYGSMGLLGIVAYTFQMHGRLWVTLQKRTLRGVTYALSYVGLLLMSMVNPGEFCPFPYGVLAILAFIMVEREPDYGCERYDLNEGDGYGFFAKV